MDRLIMFLTNNPSIQEVLFFPQMRPEKAAPAYELIEEETQIIEIQFKILSKGTSGWVSWFPTPPPELFEEGVQYIFYRFSVIAFLLSDR